MGRIARRDFLKTAPAAAGAVAYIAGANGGTDVDAAPQAKAAPRPADVRVSGTAYRPIPDYLIQPKRCFDVTLTDAFWKPKITTNADVTIPFEVQKRSETARGLGGNVLEAAILSLKTHPNAQLQAQVDARVQQIAGTPDGGNSGFEVAATYYTTTGKRDLLDPAIRSADALHGTRHVQQCPRRRVRLGTQVLLRQQAGERW